MATAVADAIDNDDGPFAKARRGRRQPRSFLRAARLEDDEFEKVLRAVAGLSW